MRVDVTEQLGYYISTDEQGVDMSKCVELKPGFSQVAVMEGTFLGEHSAEEFESLVGEWTSSRVQFLEEVKTNPDYDDMGIPIEATGNRTDIFMAVHNEDIPKFALKRLPYSIRWLEDVTSKVNRGEHLYPEYVNGYKTW